MWFAVPLPVRAQDRQPQDEPGRGFVGGSFLLWSAFGATADPEGPGYLHETFHGSLTWPALGALVNGGVLVTRHWSVGGEFAFRQQRSTTVTEGLFTHSESTDGSSRYSNREQLTSIVARRHRTGDVRVGVEPMAGFTLARTRRALTDRREVYHWFGGTIPRTPPDIAITESSYGLVGGADVAVRLRRGVSFVSGARLHWLPRRQESEYAATHVGLRAAESVLDIAAGLSWRP
jgi:hypothetical protein